MIREQVVAPALVRRGFTLIELLTVIAIIAILAAILFPVFARAKTSAKTAATSSSLRQIGMAANVYLNDYDDSVILPQWGDTDRDHLWALNLNPYLKSRAAFFDPSRPGQDKDRIDMADGTQMNWFEVTNLSINDAGYTGWWSTVSGTCVSKRTRTQMYGAYHYGRTYSAMNEPGQRIAFAPSVWTGNDVGFHLFRSWGASWPNAAPAEGPYSVPNAVFDTQTLYAGGSIPVVHADGSVGKLRRKDFKIYEEAPDLSSYCQWMVDEGQRTWGPFWSSN